MEVRLGDATANPHLAMAAVGAAVCLGIADKIEPGDKLEGYGYDPARAQILPMRLGGALDSLEADSELADVLGGYFVSSLRPQLPLRPQRSPRPWHPRQPRPGRSPRAAQQNQRPQSPAPYWDKPESF